MGRWIGRGALAACLLGLVAAGALWVCSLRYLLLAGYVHDDNSGTVITASPHVIQVSRSANAGLYVVMFGGDQGWNVAAFRYGQTITVDLTQTKPLNTAGINVAGSVTISVPRPNQGLGGFMGFSVSKHQVGSSVDRSFSVPIWFLVLVFAVWPAARVVGVVRRRRRITAGRCIVCGYDLRATPDRCPECGTAVA